jgi:hypothetical protein
MHRSPKQHGRSPMDTLGGLRTRAGGKQRVASRRKGACWAWRVPTGQLAPEVGVVVRLGNDLELLGGDGGALDEVGHQLQRLAARALEAEHRVQLEVGRERVLLRAVALVGVDAGALLQERRLAALVHRKRARRGVGRLAGLASGADAILEAAQNGRGLVACANVGHAQCGGERRGRCGRCGRPRGGSGGSGGSGGMRRALAHLLRVDGPDLGGGRGRGGAGASPHVLLHGLHGHGRA